jgi:hypothetical protein
MWVSASEFIQQISASDFFKQLGCKIFYLPLMYLGWTLKILIPKIENKLQGWKSKLLSLGRNSCIIKFYLISSSIVLDVLV